MISTVTLRRAASKASELSRLSAEISWRLNHAINPEYTSPNMVEVMLFKAHESCFSSEESIGEISGLLKDLIEELLTPEVQIVAIDAIAEMNSLTGV